MDFDAVASVLVPHARVAYVFGSVARGTARGDSDLDVAYLPRDPDMDLRAELALALALERAAGRPVDAVRLDRANALVCYAVARDGVLLHAETPAGDVRFRSRAAQEHAELAPAFRFHAARLRKRLAARAPR